MIDHELKEACSQALGRYVEQANAYYRRRMPLPKLLFDLRGATAGQMVAQRVTRSRTEYSIRLNSALLKQHVHYFTAQVLPHEVAHMVVDWIYGRRVRAHGEEWQAVMRDCFGCRPERCHSLPTVPARTHRRDYIYRCACQSHAFTARRHKSAQSGSTYLCRTCKGTLQYEGRADGALNA